jgi:hypothetical protein
VILRYVRNFHSIWAFSSEQVWCHFKIRLYGLFCFDRFCLLFRIASFSVLDGFLCSINFQKLCAMSRSVKNDCVTSEHVSFWLCTNPLMSLFRVWCGGSFQGSREEDDTIWSRRVKSLSLGMPPWFIPAYFKKTQASKLGDAQGIPFFIDNLSGHF